MSRFTAAVAPLMILAAATLPAQDTEIKGARISLRPKSVVAMAVTLENKRNSPLAQIQICVLGKGQAAPPQTYGRHFRRSPAGASESAPIEPNASRVLEVPLASAPDVDREAVVILAVFEDGYAEGHPAAIAAWRKTHEEHADDFAYWLSAFDAMPQVSAPDVHQYLSARTRERAVQDPKDPSGVRRKVQAVLEEHPLGPGVWAPLNRVRADAQREAASLPREQPASTAVEPPRLVASVSLSWRRTMSLEFVAAIENLRDVPIEAVGFNLVESASGRPEGGQVSDFHLCERESTQRGSGCIQPREVREVHLGGRPPRDGSTLRLSFVLFDDLSFEGLRAERDSLLRRREARAADYTFAIDVISEASALPADQARAFLTAKRNQRVAQRGPEGSGHDVSDIDEFIRQLTDSPVRAAANAKEFQARLELQRQRLVRHLTR